MLRTERLVAFTLAGIAVYAALGSRLDDTGPLLVLIDAYIVGGSLIAAVRRRRRRTTFVVGALLWAGAVVLSTAAVSELGRATYAASLYPGVLHGTLLLAAWASAGLLLARAPQAWSQLRDHRRDPREHRDQVRLPLDPLMSGF